MEKFSQDSINKENKIEKPKIKEGVDFVFEQNPELASIGTKEEYSQYLETIFPESKIKDIVWHGNREDFRDSGFRKDKGRDNKFSDDGQFYGFYFGDKYSHYGRSDNISYPVMVNIHKLKIVDRENGQPFLSGIDTTKNIRDQFNMTDEDGIIEIGTNYANSNFSLGEYEQYEKSIGEKFLNYLGKKFEDLENGSYEITKEDVFSYLEKEGITALGICELVVFEPEQIHILGSKSDLERFKEFTKN